MAGGLQYWATKRVAPGMSRSHPDNGAERPMLRAALAFFIIAIIAGVFGFTGIAAGAAGIAKILFWGFVILAVLALVGGLALGRRW
jgi:uncharacterized membrane protein YtjA (UPF0391 family)